MKLADLFGFNSSRVSETVSMESLISTPLLREEGVQFHSDRTTFFSFFRGKSSVLECLRNNIFTISSLALRGLITFYNWRNVANKEGNLPTDVYLSYGFALAGILWRLNWKNDNAILTIPFLEEKDTEIKDKKKFSRSEVNFFCRTH
jgi:hypothetical protein